MTFFDLFTKIFNSDFASRWTGECSGWTKELVISHNVVDFLIFFAYMSIPIMLLILKSKCKEIPFNIFFLLFAIFIIGCGLTHLSTVIVSFYPFYYFDFWIKFITALASLLTAFVLYYKLPLIISILNSFMEVKDLRKANDDLDKFAQIAAHDLQDPLKQNSVLLKLIEKNGESELFKSVYKNNLRMQTLINNLLSFARSGSTVLSIEEININKILENVLSDLNISIKESKAKIVIGEMPTLQCDVVQMSRVFQNLFKNSIKYRKMDVPLEISLTSEKKDDYYLFTMRDNGIGISATRLSNLFFMYKRQIVSKNREGTGFGLAICKNIIDRHGGEIWAESESGEGSTFYFTLPI